MEKLTKHQKEVLDKIPLGWFTPYDIRDLSHKKHAVCEILYQKGYLEKDVKISGLSVNPDIKITYRRKDGELLLPL